MSAKAIDLKLPRAARFYDATLGKKAVMAVTGAVLFAFVIGHMVGNLQIYLGREKLNHYAELLHSMPALLWGVRAALAACVILHVTAALQLWLIQRAARPVGYFKKANLGSDYASRTMLWSGPIIGVFVVYHLLHLTTGTVHPSFAVDAAGRLDVYSNVVRGFQVVWVSLFYIVAMVLLGFHLYHGVWSMFQTLGVSHPRYTPWLKRLSAAAGVILAAGNISIPVAVLSGLVRL